MTRDTTPDIESADVQDEAGDKDFKRRLLLRAGIAALLIVVLLAGLALFDDANTPKPKSVEPLAEAPTRPASLPVGGTSQVPPLTEAPTSEDTALEQIEDSASAATEETSAPPTIAENVVRQSNVAEEAGVSAERPLTKPATARLAMLKPQAANSPAQLQPAQPPQASLRSDASQELKRQASPPPMVAAPASRPLSRAAATVKGYLLQLGVFNSTIHAEELRAKLELAGIPAQIEARVQVGPYATREEAEQMRSKLRQLGLEEGVLVATKK